MNVVILGLGQHMDFQTREAINLLSLALPNGANVQIQVDDDVARSILQALIGEPPEVPEDLPQRAPRTAHEVFGTEETDEGAAFVMSPEVVDNVRVEAPPPRQPMVRKSRLIGKDNAGNPIVEFIGGNLADVSDAVGTVGDRDEDGVSQL